MPCVISHLKSKRSWRWNLLKNSGCMATSTCTDSAQISRWGEDWMVHIVFSRHFLPAFPCGTDLWRVALLCPNLPLVEVLIMHYWYFGCCVYFSDFISRRVTAGFGMLHGLGGKQRAPFWLGCGGLGQSHCWEAQPAQGQDWARLWLWQCQLCHTQGSQMLCPKAGLSFQGPVITQTFNDNLDRKLAIVLSCCKWSPNWSKKCKTRWVAGWLSVLSEQRKLSGL